MFTIFENSDYRPIDWDSRRETRILVMSGPKSVKISGAEGGSRTRTSFRTTDFKSGGMAHYLVLRNETKQDVRAKRLTTYHFVSFRISTHNGVPQEQKMAAVQNHWYADSLQRPHSSEA
jgi:hypothetical protein